VYKRSRRITTFLFHVLISMPDSSGFKYVCNKNTVERLEAREQENALINAELADIRIRLEQSGTEKDVVTNQLQQLQ
jgi:hypothetical protein